MQVINLRSIRPLDRATINASVRKTNRLVTVEEGFPQHGVGAEIWFVSCHQYIFVYIHNIKALTMYLLVFFGWNSTSIIEDSFGYLDAPVQRIAGADVPMPYATNLERLAVPQVRAASFSLNI